LSYGKQHKQSWPPTGTYGAWRRMKDRCRNPNNPSYARYGARGIKVCDRWNKFKNFWQDVGDRPGPEYSLDRIDNNGDYEPGNVRWATARQQQNNQDRTIWLSHMGMDRPINEWAEITGIKLGTLDTRYRRGWSHEEIICGKH